MALRSLDQRFWTDPYIESLNATEKLVYIHLFSSAHTNLVGVFQASRRMIAFQTACPEPDVEAALERFGRDGKALIDGGEVWLASYIRHQCTSSPKMVAAMRGQLAKVESDAIRKAILDRYPYIMDPPSLRPSIAYRSDRVSLPSRYKKEERKRSAGAAPCAGAPAKRPESGSLAVSDEVARILRRDFPQVDFDAQMERIRNWRMSHPEPIRNILLFTRKWFSNAARLVHQSPIQSCEATSRDVRPHPRPPETLFREPTEAELEENARRGAAILALWRQRQLAALA